MDITQLFGGAEKVIEEAWGVAGMMGLQTAIEYSLGAVVALSLLAFIIRLLRGT